MLKPFMLAVCGFLGPYLYGEQAHPGNTPPVDLSKPLDSHLMDIMSKWYPGDAITIVTVTFLGTERYEFMDARSGQCVASFAPDGNGNGEDFDGIVSDKMNHPIENHFEMPSNKPWYRVILYITDKVSAVDSESIRKQLTIDLN